MGRCVITACLIVAVGVFAALLYLFGTACTQAPCRKYTCSYTDNVKRGCYNVYYNGNACVRCGEMPRNGTCYLYDESYCPVRVPCVTTGLVGMCVVVNLSLLFSGIVSIVALCAIWICEPRPADTLSDSHISEERGERLPLRAAELTVAHHDEL